jgi:GTP:adenosylcobinamide-phosphate guanylyltransferase
MAEFKIPTENVSLPSKGLLYPESSVLSKGEIEMKYMTAKEEDILTNVNYIKNGTVIDKLLQALIITKIDFNELLVGDKNAILLAARILGYGKDYEFKYKDQNTGEILQATIDLTQLKDKEIDETLITKGKNEFSFQLPTSKNDITFKLLSHGDEQNIEAEIKGLKKVNSQGSFDMTTRLKYIITSVNGKRESKDIREFVDNGYLIARDARALREYYNKISPDVEIKYYPEGAEEGIDVPIGVSFFWPDAGI